MCTPTLSETAARQLTGTLWQAVIFAKDVVDTFLKLHFFWIADHSIDMSQG